MFTGIIEALGKITEVTKVDQGVRLETSYDAAFDDIKTGDSIAVNGVCLTVVQADGNRVRFDVSAETLHRTNLGSIKEGERVNLERPVTLAARLGGHLVQGHVDATGRLESVTPSGEGFVLRVSLPPEVSRYVVEKGSIAVDGISLTVATIDSEWFDVAIIPHTWRATNLSSLQPGALVNLEVDVIAKYVEKLMSPLQRNVTGMGD